MQEKEPTRLRGPRTPERLSDGCSRRTLWLPRKMPDALSPPPPPGPSKRMELLECPSRGPPHPLRPEIPSRATPPNGSASKPSFPAHLAPPQQPSRESSHTALPGSLVPGSEGAGEGALTAAHAAPVAAIAGSAGGVAVPDHSRNQAVPVFSETQATVPDALPCAGVAATARTSAAPVEGAQRKATARTPLWLL